MRTGGATETICDGGTALFGALLAGFTHPPWLQIVARGRAPPAPDP